MKVFSSKIDFSFQNFRFATIFPIEMTGRSLEWGGGISGRGAPAYSLHSIANVLSPRRSAATERSILSKKLMVFGIWIIAFKPITI